MHLWMCNNTILQYKPTILQKSNLQLIIAYTKKMSEQNKQNQPSQQQQQSNGQTATNDPNNPNDGNDTNSNPNANRNEDGDGGNNGAGEGNDGLGGNKENEKKEQGDGQQQASTPTLPTSSKPAQSSTAPPKQMSQSQKQKQKQIKVLQTKNKKLQAKYIQLFKQQKMLKKDWGVFTSFIKAVFAGNSGIEERQMGKWDLDQLKELWNVKESRYVIRIQELVENREKEREKMYRQLTQGIELKIDQITRDSRQKVQIATKQLDSFKKNNKNLADQLSDYDKKLDIKSQQVSKLTKQKLKLEHYINQIKMKSITDELVPSEQKKKAEQEKIAAERNQLLALRHQVGNLMDKRDQLREQLKKAEQTINKLKTQLGDKDKLIAKLKQGNKDDKPKVLKSNSNHSNPGHNLNKTLPVPSKQPQKQKNQGKSSVIPQAPVLKSKQSISSSQQNEKDQEPTVSHHHLIGDDEYVHREYMKNVFIRFMKSYMRGDANQSDILLGVILTLLKFNNKEKELIKEKRKGWWGIY